MGHCYQVKQVSSRSRLIIELPSCRVFRRVLPHRKYGLISEEVISKRNARSTSGVKNCGNDTPLANFIKNYITNPLITPTPHYTPSHRQYPTTVTSLAPATNFSVTRMSPRKTPATKIHTTFCTCNTIVNYTMFIYSFIPNQRFSQFILIRSRVQHFETNFKQYPIIFIFYYFFTVFLTF